MGTGGWPVAAPQRCITRCDIPRAVHDLQADRPAFSMLAPRAGRRHQPGKPTSPGSSPALYNIYGTWRRRDARHDLVRRLQVLFTSFTNTGHLRHGRRRAAVAKDGEPALFGVVHSLRHARSARRCWPLSVVSIVCHCCSTARLVTFLLPRNCSGPCIDPLTGFAVPMC